MKIGTQKVFSDTFFVRSSYPSCTQGTKKSLADHTCQFVNLSLKLNSLFNELLCRRQTLNPSEFNFVHMNAKLNNNNFLKTYLLHKE
jgi:hypothetical protein